MTPPLGGEGAAAGRDASHDAAPAGGWIGCAICEELIVPDQYRNAHCWKDPGGNDVAAHSSCLLRIGDYDDEGLAW